MRKPSRVTLITTGRLDAVLHEPPPERTQHTIGRPRVEGLRLPALEEVLQDPQTRLPEAHPRLVWSGGANPGDLQRHSACLWPSVSKLEMYKVKLRLRVNNFTG